MVKQRIQAPAPTMIFILNACDVTLISIGDGLCSQDIMSLVGRLVGHLVDLSVYLLVGYYRDHSLDDMRYLLHISRSF